MEDKFELPPSSLKDSYAETGKFTIYQTTGVLYHILNFCQGKSVVFLKKMQIFNR